MQVVLINQVTTRFLPGAQSKIVPALGEPPVQQSCSSVSAWLELGLHAGDSWAHAATSRVMLYMQGDKRMAFLHKSPSMPARAAEYAITSDGVRGRRRPKRSHQEASVQAAGGS